MRPGAWALLALRVALGSVFVVSGFQKLLAPAENFAAVIEQFELVRGAVSQALAHVVPWIEFVGGVFFALGLQTRLSLPALWLLNTGFIGVLSTALFRKLPIEQCGCFGEAVKFSPSQMLGLDILLWLLFLVFFASYRRLGPPSLDTHSE